MTPFSNSATQPWHRLQNTTAWAIVAAFGTYFCMYAFRKPFTAAKFEDLTLWGAGFKTVAVTAQVLGYTISKFIGIKVISEMAPRWRAVSLLVLIGSAELALLFFGLCPPPYNFVFLFLNGLPLGMVFGLVLGFLEGRRMTEALTAGLCASFIVADGAVKSVGLFLMQRGVSEFWMPCATGLIFAGPLVTFVWMLRRMPPPSPVDVASRTERITMNRGERRQFFGRYALGLSLLVMAYLLVTILRSFRADFMPELWSGLAERAGLENRTAPEYFTYTELLVALGVTLLTGLSVLIRHNRRAFFSSLALATAGFGVLAGALAAREIMAPFAFMTLTGLGLYIPYVAVHTTVFERLIAMTRDRGTIGYLMYLADAVGYLGYVAVMLGKEMLHSSQRLGDVDFVSFFESMAWIIVILGASCFAMTWVFFARRAPTSVIVESGTV